jgi:hypothetical protein
VYQPVEIVGTCAQVQNDRPVEAEIGKPDAHRRRDRQRIGALDLDANTAAAQEQRQIEFGALVRRGARSTAVSRIIPGETDAPH